MSKSENTKGRKPVHLVLAGPDAREVALARQLFAADGLPGELKVEVRPDFRAITDLNDGRHLVLIYAGCVSKLAHSMMAGQSPDVALQKWILDAEALLDMVKRHRRSAILVEASHVERWPGPFFKALNERTAKHFEPPEKIERKTGSQPNDLFWVIAEQAVAHNSVARKLDLLLEARALPPQEKDGRIRDRSAPAFTAFEALQRSTGILADNGGNASLRQDAPPARPADDAAAALHKENDRLTAETAAQAVFNKAEKDLLLSQLHTVQEEYEVHLNLADTVQKDLEAVIRDRDMELDRIFNSKSWKVTQPLRSMRRIFTRAPDPGEF